MNKYHAITAAGTGLFALACVSQSGVAADRFFSDMLFCAPTALTQMVLAVVWSLLWYIILPLFREKIYRPYVQNHPSKEQLGRLSQQSLKDFGIDASVEEAIDINVDSGNTALQHFVGGLLCVPSVFGCFGLPEAVTTAMACQGAISEVGWEIQDTIVRVWQWNFGGEEGKKQSPPAMVLILAVHHFMALALVIPMNLYLPALPEYHELIMLLQISGSTTLASSQMCMLCNMKLLGDRLKLIATVIGQFFIVIWARGIRFGVLVPQLVNTIGRVSDSLFTLAVVSAALMALINLMHILDAVSKVFKFTKLLISKAEAAEDSKEATVNHEQPASQKQDLATPLLKSDATCVVDEAESEPGSPVQRKRSARGGA